MTGFGRSEVNLGPSGQAVVEIHTLNHKFLDVECRLPEGLDFVVEESIRTMVGRVMNRGRVRVTLSMKMGISKSAATFRMDLAQRYLRQLKQLKNELGIAGPVTMEMLLALPQVVALPQKEQISPDHLWPRLKSGVAQALSRAAQMRRSEGKRLSRAVDQWIRRLETANLQIRRKVPAAQAQFKQRLTRRIQAASRPLDKKSAASEAAAIVQATDVSEELARIHSHLTALRQTLRDNPENAGRTIDFLGQELTREVNTLGAKVRDARVVQTVVGMKNVIEKLREQAANVE